MWISYGEGSIVVMSQKDESELGTLRKHDSEVRILCHVTWKSTDFIFSGDASGVIHVWNPTRFVIFTTIMLKTNKQQTLIKDPPVCDMCVVTHYNVTQIWIGSYQDIYVIEIPDESTPTFNVKPPWQAHSNRIRSLVAVGQQVWSCSTDCICIWDTRMSEESPSKGLSLPSLPSLERSEREKNSSSLQSSNEQI